MSMKPDHLNQEWIQAEDEAGGVLAAGGLVNYDPGKNSLGPIMAPAQPYGIVDPDYARVYTQARIIAWQYGYACVMHGSFTRDLDLLLVPWEDRAYSSIVLPILKQIAASCELQLKCGPEGEAIVTQKPHGRQAYTLHFPGFHDRRWVDVSVMPCIQKAD